jgi:TPR repeat protein
MYNLGMLEIATGNTEKGKKWLKMAAANKHPQAKQKLEAVATLDPTVL